MGAKKLEKFGGMLPAWIPELTPDGQAVNASNCYLMSGGLDGWRVPSVLRTLTNSAAKFVYRLPITGQSVAYAYLNFIANPSPGDTVTVGEYVYNWVTSIAGANLPVGAAAVQIGGNTVLSATYLLNAITGDNGTYANLGSQYNFGMVANPDVAGLTNQLGAINAVLPATNVGVCMFITAPAYGAAFNQVDVAESTNGARTLWLMDSNSRSDTTTTFVGGTNPSQNTAITASSNFLEFLDPDTSVVKSQVALDQYERYYFASPSQPPQYNTRSRINAGTAPLLLGIPAPANAPTVAVTGGGNTGTLGPTVTNGGQVTVGSNTCYLIPIIPNGSFLISDVSWVPNFTVGTLNWQAVVYEDNNPAGNTPTYPGGLCNASPTFTGVTAGTNAVGTFSNPCTTIPNTVYWIGIMTDTSISVETADNAGASVAFPAVFSNGPPPVAPPVVTGEADLVMWADITSSVVQESRAYVYTYISAYGEEGPPSPFTLVNGWGNGSWHLGLTLPPALDIGSLRNIAIMRVYRAVTATTGLTTYFQVVDISVGSTDPDAIQFVAIDGALPVSTNYVDTISDTTVAQNIQLTSTNYFSPPPNLQGFLNLPNGGIAAFRGQEVWFCEPYLPHAWPFGYMQTVDYPIVGLGLTTGTVVAATTANPFVLQFINPGQITVFKCTAPAPCLSRGSIVSLDAGVLYMSPNGLIQVPNSGTMANLSETWIKREDWDSLTPQKNTRAVYLAGMYYCWGTTNGAVGSATEDTSVAQEGFALEIDTDVASFGIWPQPGGHRIGFMPLTSPIGNVDNVYIDPWSGQTVYIANGTQYFLDFTNTNPTIQAYDFLTKKYREVAKKNFTALRVYFTRYNTSPGTNNPAPNIAPAYDPSWNTLQPQQLAIIKVWADVNNGFQDGSMQLVMARELTRNGQIMRIQDGFKAESWQVEVLAQVKISNIQFATSVQELGEV